MTQKKQKVHFMGIGGSGMSAVALLAHEAGYIVEGSDLQADTPYLSKVKKAGIKTYVGHTSEVLDGVDLLAVTPAVYFNTNNDFLDEAKERNVPVVTWQEFMGRFLHRDKRLIAVSGTHGKSTTTTLLGLLYESAGKDPTVEVGATVAEWNSNFRYGKSDIFISEADEFYGNFLHYHPDVIILNNIEFDHPDYFTSESHLFETFESFIKNIQGEKLLIINQDSEGIATLLDRLDIDLLESLKIIGYTLSDSPYISVPNSFRAIDIVRSTVSTEFSVDNSDHTYNENFSLTLTGDYNISNALGVIALSAYDMIDPRTVRSSLKLFKGAGRRMELLGEKHGCVVFDDYAHHPTAIKATLAGLRQRYPKKTIICVSEPHSFSRTKTLLPLYENAFNDADIVCIAPIYKARDTEEFGVSGKSIVTVSGHTNCRAFDSLEEVQTEVVKKATKDCVIIVMGAGKSYQLARDIFSKL